MSKCLSQSLLVFCAGVWSVAMVVVGALLVLDWPQRFGWSHGPWLVVGAALIAAGQFVFALVAARVFPETNPKVAGAFEALPWVGLVVLLAGGWLW